MERRRYRSRLGAGSALALGGAFALACAGAPPPLPATPPRISGEIAEVQVTLADELAPRDAHSLREGHAAGTLRQSLLDWLEQAERLDPHGELRVRIELRGLRLRSSAVSWLLAGWAPPDRLDASVIVLRGSEEVARYPTAASSTLGGWAWRDPARRLDRLARRLGGRVAEEL
jgi:hypothetical protein